MTRDYGIPPFIIRILVMRIGGMNQFKKLHPKVRYIFIGDELKAWKQELYHKFGNQSNYLKDWRKRNGYKRKIDYENYLAQVRGFKNMTEYLNSRYRLKGFKDRAEFQREYRKKKKLLEERKKDGEERVEKKRIDHKETESR